MGPWPGVRDGDDVDRPDSGGGDRQRRGPGGQRASRDHGEAGKEVGVAEATLWWRVDGGQSSPEKKKGLAEVYGGEEARSRLYIGQQRSG